MAAARRGPAGWVRLVLRGAALGAVTYGGLGLLLLLRLIERPLFGPVRPVTPYITQTVCRAFFLVTGIRHSVRGRPMTGKGALVANHAAWLDIFALNAADRIYFVSKSEVAGWAGIGWLARATGTLFITRKGTEAKRQQAEMEMRLRAGNRLLFFPEGTSTDTRRILPFKSTLFAAFFSHGLADLLWVQPVTVAYSAPEGADPRFYGFWGDMDFGPSFAEILAAGRQGRVEVVFHAPVRVADFADRKALSAHCEAMVRGAHPDGEAAG